jgi:hypothetical protein
MGAEGFGTLASRFTDRTIVTYEARKRPFVQVHLRERISS